MYTGTLINDLMATVERAEHGVRRCVSMEEQELRMFEAIYVETMPPEPVLVGAA